MKPDILIVGAGIMGAALAHRLTTLGASVTVVEADTPASAASGRSFGWVNASFFLSEAHFDLRHAAMRAHVSLARELKHEQGPQGCLWYEEEGDDFDARHRDLVRLDYPLRLLNRAEIAALEPNIANPPDRALLFPSEQAVDLPLLTELLLAAASAKGARIFTGTPADAFTEGQGRVTGIRTFHGVIRAEHTILATGNGTPALLAPLGLHFPMLKRPGAIFRSQPLPPLLTHILATQDQEVRQDTTGHLIAPAAAHHQSDDAEEIADPTSLMEATLGRLCVLFPTADIRTDRLTLALRPVPGDGLPAIGAVVPGLSMAVMHSGATLAPHAANLLAAEVMGQGDSRDLTPFRPTRFWNQ